MESDLRILTPEPVDEGIIRLLHLISDTIQHHFLPTLLRNGFVGVKLPPGIRSIQNGRWELFIQSENVICQAFEDLCSLLRPQLPEQLQSTEEVRTALIAYAQSTAKLDPRLHTAPTRLQFGHAYSFIITNGIVPAQLPHIDIMYDDFQFGLIVTDNVPPTNAYRVKQNPMVRTPDALAQFLQVDPDSTNLVPAINSFPHCVRLLNQFGACLSTIYAEDYELSPCECEVVRTGSVVSLPGGVLHAGPAVSKFRTVLFFSAHVGRLYNPDVQYFDGLLLADLMLPIWPFLTMSDRWCLLRKLKIVVDRYGSLPSHFRSLPEFERLLHQWKQSTDAEAFMESCLQMPQLARMPVGCQLPEKLTCVSAKHLFTMYEGISYAIVVYRRPNGAVCIQYQSTLEWEGTDAKSNPYELRLNKGCSIFNGKNGTLTDGNGDEIECFVSSPTILAEHNKDTS